MLRLEYHATLSGIGNTPRTRKPRLTVRSNVLKALGIKWFGQHRNRFRLSIGSDRHRRILIVSETLSKGHGTTSFGPADVKKPDGNRVTMDLTAVGKNCRKFPKQEVSFVVSYRW